MAQREAKGASLKVLIVRFSAIGDCVLAGYAVNDLRRSYPNAEISWVIEDRCDGIVSEGKLVNRRLSLPRSEWRKRGDIPTLFEQYRWHSGLRRYGFDYGFDMQGHSKTAWCLRLSGAKKRLSIGATDAIARRLNPVLNEPSLENLHSVERGRKLISHLLTLENHASDFLPGQPVVPEKDLVTVCIGAGHPAKQIPTETLIEIGKQLTGKSYRVVYLGGPKDFLENPTGTTNLAGQTTLEESIQWIRNSAVHIAGDTGTGHIAAAVGTPLVTIWGNMPLSRFRPYTEKLTLINREGNPAKVSPQEIVDAATGWLR